jgi:hypothetical protein
MSKKGLLALMALAAMGSLTDPFIPEPVPLTADEKKRRKIARYKMKGLKLFIINGREIWALNEKNAQRKSKTNSHV